jgi:hypothetical protein
VITDADIISFRREHRLDLNPAVRKIWLAQLGGAIMPLPNFRWRRQIVDAHDRHHLMTGHPPTLRGELLVAAWEAGSGCYSDWRARTLCAALMALGLVIQPLGTSNAFRAGRQVKSGGSIKWDG